MSDEKPELHLVLARELPRLHAFAFLATGSRDAAFAALRGVAEYPAAEVRSAASAELALLGCLVRYLREESGRRPSWSFQKLDDLLRAEPTLPVDHAAPPIDGDRRRLPVLVAEVQRSCLVTALTCLRLSDRLAFLLVDVLGQPESVALDLLETTPVGLDVRLRRARKRLADYLGPRCGHVARNNPCSCENRLAIALAEGFVTLPREPEPPLEAGPTQDLGALYRRLLALRAPPVGTLVDPADP